MNLRNRRRTGRGGFTLIELLVVLVIIGILVSLIAAAVVQAFRKGKTTRTVSEVQQLAVALESFKTKFGFYPPSRFLVAEWWDDYNASVPGIGQDSLAVIQRMFPRIAFSKAGDTIDWNGTGAIEPIAPGTPLATTAHPFVILEGDQCLVFFLGGIPGPCAASGGSGPPSCLGFAENSQNPADPLTTKRIGPFFDFQSSRLVIYNPLDFPNSLPSQALTYVATPTFVPNDARPLAYRKATGVNPFINFYSYMDPYGATDGLGGYTGIGTPYAYFSSYNVRNGYNKYFNTTVPNSDCSGLIAVRPNVSNNAAVYGSVWPYAESNPAAGLQYLKPNSFQIISAGLDGVFGSGTDPVVPLSGSGSLLLWTPSTAANVYPNGANAASTLTLGSGNDDQSSFTGSTLGVGQD